MATLFRNSFRSKNYQRVTTSTVITRSLLFWTEGLECFWLLHLYASHLCAIDGNKEWFTCLQITVRDSVASIVIGDGNGKTLASQRLEYTDFRLERATLYAVWEDPYWVIMLPSDY